MENNWPETVDELLAECQRLISKYDLYMLGERGEPFPGEAEPRVDGTEYLAGEYQYGIAMIPAQWVTHVIDSATLGGGECEMVTSGTPCEGNTDKACTACGAYNIGEFYDGQSHRAVPNFCPNCGRSVKR